MRYRQIIDILKEIKPRSIIEIGTHKAARPIEWSEICKFKYYGFDIFDDGTEELNKKEKNGKGFCSKKYAKDKLKNANIDNILFKGNTNDTLYEFVNNFSKKIDFAFIDGGHCVETIQSDYDNIREVMNSCGVIVFDDYYTKGVDIKKFGCNKTVENIEHELLPNEDCFEEVGIKLVKA